MKIVLFGLSGSGTTTLGKAIAKEFNLDFQSTGNLMRKKAKELSMDLYDFDVLCQSQTKYDLELDEQVKIYGETHNNFIFESRLAWYFILDAFKINCEVSKEESYKRISQREEISFEEAKLKTKKRNEELTTRYKKIYPNVPYPPKKEIFNYTLDTNNKPIEKCIAELIKILKKEKNKI